MIAKPKLTEKDLSTRRVVKNDESSSNFFLDSSLRKEIIKKLKVKYIIDDYCKLVVKDAITETLKKINEKK